LRPETLILAFDTSAAHCAAALLRGPRVLALRHEEMGRGQAERLFPLLEEMLAGAGCGWTALDAVAVGTGPGNFTGTRIAVAAARGLALSLGVPAIGVTGFEALAEGAPGPVLATLAAPRGQVYLQRLDGGRAGPAEIADPDTWTPPPGAPAALCLGAEAGRLAARLGWQAGTPRHAPAEAIARAALGRVGHKAPRPAPVYLRPADAAPPADAPPTILP